MIMKRPRGNTLSGGIETDNGTATVIHLENANKTQRYSILKEHSSSYFHHRLSNFTQINRLWGCQMNNHEKMNRKPLFIFFSMDIQQP